MKKTVTVIALSVLCVGAFAAPAKKQVRPKYTPEEIARIRAESKQRVYERTGGEIQKPGVGKGLVAIYNGQSRVAESNLVSVIRHLEAVLRVKVAIRPIDGPVTDRNAAELRKAKGGDVAVFLVDDKSSPNALLVQPEARWSIVNVAALAADNPSAPFVATRLRKELVRGFLYAANGGDSQYPHSLMGTVYSMKDLDDIARPNPPMDVVSRVVKNLPAMNMERWERTTYLDACQEGWAPAPTNDVQKAIWDKVHAIPKNPMKIEFDPKKGR